MKWFLFIFGIIGLLIAVSLVAIAFIYPSIEHFAVCLSTAAYIVFRVIREDCLHALSRRS